MKKREKRSAGPLDKLSKNQLPDRIAELERGVTQLQKDVAMLKQLSDGPYWAPDGNQLEEKNLGNRRRSVTESYSTTAMRSFSGWNLFGPG